MKIKYIHVSDPEKIKIHDTEAVRKNTFFNRKPQQEVDEMTLEHMERDKARGLILYYEIINDTPEDLPDFTSAAASFCEPD